MSNPSHSTRFNHSKNFGWGERIISSSDSPQHPARFLQHPQHTFLLQCEPSSFAPIQNNEETNSSMYLNLLNFG
jgi:hypothetical protein